MAPPPPPSPSPRAAATREARISRVRWLRASAIALGILIASVIAAGVAGIATEWGARSIWHIVGRVLPGTLSGTITGGTLADGLDMRDVVYKDHDRTVRIDRLAARWQLALAPRRLTIATLEIGQADVTLVPSPPKPLTLPTRIALPLPIELQRAHIAGVILHQGASTTQYDDILLSAGSDGLRHRLKLDNAITPFGALQATVRLGGAPPFAIEGSAGLVTLFQKQRYDLDATFKGTLAALGVNLRGSGGALTGSADIDATPFDPVPFRRVRIDFAHVDPKVYSASAPHADLTIRGTLAPVAATPGTPRLTDLSKLVVSGPLTISNAAPGPIDKGLLPVVSGQADVTLDPTRQQLRTFQLRLPGNATVAGSGELRGADGNFKLQVAALDLHALHSALKPTQLAGPIDIGLTKGTQTIVAALTSTSLAINADALIDAQQVVLRSARLQAAASQLNLTGSLARDVTASYAVKGALKDFDPALVLQQVQTAPASTSGKHAVKPRAAAPVHARINMDFDASGALQPALAAKLHFGIHDSVYNNLPMTGGGDLQILGQRLVSSNASVSIAGNDVAIKGSFGASTDRLDFRIAAPALDRLGFGLAGLAQAQGRLAGTIAHPVIDATYKARGLVIGANRLALLGGEAHVDGVPGENPNAKVILTVNAEGIHAAAAAVDLDRFDARINGTYARHTIDLTALGSLSGQPLALTVAAQGSIKPQEQGYAWDGVVRTLDNRGVPRVAIGAPLTLKVAPGRITLGATRLTLGPADIDLKGFEYGPGLIRSEGAFNGLQVADLLELRRKFTAAPAPVKTSLALDGSWKFSLAETATGFLQIARRGGDIVAATPYGESALGINALRLRADLQGTSAAITTNFGATRIGTLAAQGTIGLIRSGGGLTVGAASPLAATVTGAMPQLRSLGVLAGPQVALDGSISLNLAATGSVGAPRFSGNVNGDRLALTLFDQGVRLKDGTARITLDNNFVDLREVVFHGGSGTLRATGRIPLEPTGQDLTALITAERLELLSDPSRQLTLSGQARMANVGQQLQVTGRFTVDRALFTLPDKAAPQLSDDVVIVHQGAAPKKPLVLAPPPLPAAPKPASMASLLPPRVNVTIDLGNSFRFKGAGADLFLAGALDVRSGPNQPPQAFGTVRVVSGVYEAFGAKLAIERGLITFQGGFENPSINILAMRRNQAVPAGVQVTGTVRQPRLDLTSEPNLPEEEKLSWLVFGHASSATAGSGQAQGAVQSAALGLLNKFGGSSIANRVGLDQLSIGASEYGKTGAQVVNLGKEISNRLYVGYEQGLAGASSVVKLTYEMTQNWSLVVRGGAVTGMDVLYSRRFDKLTGKPPTP